MTTPIFWIDLLPKVQAIITRLAVENNDPLWAAQGAEWQPQPHVYVSPDAALQIDLIVTNSGDGDYETRYVPFTDPDTGITADRAYLTGQREFVLNVQCKGYQADFAHWALIYAERIRTGLQRIDVLDEVQALGMCFWKYNPIFNIEGKEDGQALTIANMDLFGRAGFGDDPTTAPLVQLFASITVTSKFAGYTDGQPPNFTDTITAPVAL